MTFGVVAAASDCPKNLQPVTAPGYSQKKDGPRRGRLSLPGKAVVYQKNLNRTWIWRGRMFWVDTLAGITPPKLALVGSVLRLSRP